MRRIIPYIALLALPFMTQSCIPSSTIRNYDHSQASAYQGPRKTQLTLQQIHQKSLDDIAGSGFVDSEYLPKLSLIDFRLYKRIFYNNTLGEYNSHNKKVKVFINPGKGNPRKRIQSSQELQEFVRKINSHEIAHDYFNSLPEESKETICMRNRGYKVLLENMKIDPVLYNRVSQPLREALEYVFFHESNYKDTLFSKKDFFGHECFAFFYEFQMTKLFENADFALDLGKDRNNLSEAINQIITLLKNPKAKPLDIVDTKQTLQSLTHLDHIPDDLKPFYKGLFDERFFK